MATTHQAEFSAAETSLSRELYPKLRRFAAVVGPSEVDPNDLVQEALVRVMQHQPLSSLDHPSAWRLTQSA